MAIKTDAVGFSTINQSEATFRKWAQFARDCFALGFVQTADTGQIDLYQAGAFTSTGGSLPQGYNIFRMADALQASYPVFMKLEYMTWGGASISPAIWLTVGTGSDGAGNLTGIFVVRFNLPCGNASGSTLPAYGSGGTNYAVFAIGTNATPFCLSIERSVDATGTVTGEGVIVVVVGGTGVSTVASTKSIYGIAIGTQPAIETGVHVVLTSQNPSSFGINVGVSLMVPYAGVAKQPGFGFLAIRQGDFVIYSSIALSVYGATHTFLRLGDSIQTVRNNGAGVMADANIRLCCRYE